MAKAIERPGLSDGHRRYLEEAVERIDDLIAFATPLGEMHQRHNPPARIGDVSAKAKWLRRALLTALDLSPNLNHVVPMPANRPRPRRPRSLRDPYVEGVNAGTAAADETENPYPAGEENDQWLMGFTDARTAAKDRLSDAIERIL